MPQTGPTRTYDPKGLTVTVLAIAVTGFADGDFVSVTRDADTFSDNVGATGEVERAKTNDWRGTIKIVVMQTNKDTLTALSTLAVLDEVSNGGIVPITVQSWQDVHTAPECWLKKMPDAVYGKEAGKGRSFEFRCANVSMFFGGSGWPGNP